MSDGDLEAWVKSSGYYSENSSSVRSHRARWRKRACGHDSSNC